MAAIWIGRFRGYGLPHARTCNAYMVRAVASSGRIRVVDSNRALDDIRADLAALLEPWFA